MRARREVGAAAGLMLAGLVLAGLLAGGCQYGAYFFRAAGQPMQALDIRVDPAGRRDCVVVLLPGMLNTPDSYLEHGFVEDAIAASRRCDLVAADAHYGYYRQRILTERVGEDILQTARRRGYRTIWLVGSSMGGMGAMRVARAYPDLVDGVVLLGPWFGDGGVVREIEAAGGLGRWAGPRRDLPPQDSASLWGWMRGYATHPDRMPPLYIAMGESDGIRAGSDLLGAHLPPSRYGLAPGGHAWETWRVLWRRLLAHPPWDPRGAEPGFDSVTAPTRPPSR